MGKSILITGGTRSGKSQLAEDWTLAAGQPAFYIATAEAFDTEMEERIAQHQARRGAVWQTLAEPLDLVSALNQTDGKGPRLVDCLTLWLSNLMHAKSDIETTTKTLIETLHQQASPVIFVTNEVGSGIVPENALARSFRDAQGRLNQAIAAEVDEVYLAVVGLPLKVK